MKKNILITGATGFIGRFLVDEAIARGYEVYAAVRKTSQTEYLKSRNVHISELNFFETEALGNEISRLPHFDFIIHNAGITKSLNKEEYFEVNYRCTKRLIYALEQNNKNPDKFLFISSLAAFGPGERLSSKSVMLTSEPKPVTSYGKSKLMAENFIIERGKMSYIIFRPTAVYGPGEKDIFEMLKLMNKRLEFKIGFKNQNLTFVYVKDLSRLAFDALESDVVNRSYFISDGNLYTDADLGRIAAETLEKKVFRIALPIKAVKMIAFFSEKVGHLKGVAPALNVEKVNELSADNWNCDTAPLRKDFNFKPEFDLKKGMAETIHWYRSNGWL